MLCLGKIQPYSRANTRLERLASDKHSCLLQSFVNYDRKRFYSNGPWFTSFCALKYETTLFGFALIGPELKHFYLCNYDQSAAIFCHQVAAWVSDMFCNPSLVKNHITANKSATTDAREKISTYLESLEF